MLAESVRKNLGKETSPWWVFLQEPMSAVSASMATTNIDEIEAVWPRPFDDSMLTLQAQHQSDAIWNGWLKHNTKSNCYVLNSILHMDLGALTYRNHIEEFTNLKPMVDDRVVDITKGVGLEGLLRTSGREIDHRLITALVEQWRLKTHTFHMPHGEVTITLQDVEVLLGLPIDGKAVTWSIEKVWKQVCQDFLGFSVPDDNTKELQGQRIVIKRLFEQVVFPLPPNAEEDQLHKYARCYMLALLGDTIFMDKSNDRVHLMKDVDIDPLVLDCRWLWVPNKKNRPSNVFLHRYREQIVSKLPDQVVWQPYEAELCDLLAYCVAGRAMWMATMPIVCFHLVEKHTSDRVVRQFRMVQEIPQPINTDVVLHRINLRGKVSVS
ncbi:hypothetical protein SO802_011638 [Lithocarpus litseifolius]|uniref:Aminotransferase-like plant mobile domain-containing protein n=1 Tax=Lithocarpus litseifolius TaxID=425828 RepID=A0AAW2D180_9ROSI